MKNLRFIPYISIHQPIVKAAFAFDRGLCAHVSKKDFANIKRPLDWIIDNQNTDNILVTLINI